MGRLDLVASTVTLAMAFVSAGSAFAAEDCTRTSTPGPLQPGAPLDPSGKLSSSKDAGAVPPEPINAGGSNRTDAAVLADPALPETVTPEQIYFNVPTELRRANTKVETAHLPKPTFTEPVIANKGTQIQFDICINDNGPAGTYTGSVLVGGPKNLQPVTLAVTVNKKDSTLFWAGIIVGSLIAFALLYLKEWKTIRDKYSKHTSRRGSRAWHALVRDLPTHAVIVISVVGAAAASYKIYTDNPAWGEDGAASWLALIGSMLAAIGGASLVTALRSGGPGADETPD